MYGKNRYNFMVAALQALNLFNKPVAGIEKIGGNFGAGKARRVEGPQQVTSPYGAIASTNCELTPDVSGGGYTHGVGAFESKHNWMF